MAKFLTGAPLRWKDGGKRQGRTVANGTAVRRPKDAV
jgi:hypothetical protein